MKTEQPKQPKRHGMRAKRPDTKWQGVYFDPKYPTAPYRAWVKFNNKLVQLGRYATPLEAILAADLARYIIFGIDPTKWVAGGRKYPPKPPNTIPHVDLPFDPQTILNKLAGVVDGITMANNWTAYREAALKLAELTGKSVG